MWLKVSVRIPRHSITLEHKRALLPLTLSWFFATSASAAPTLSQVWAEEAALPPGRWIWDEAVRVNAHGIREVRALIPADEVARCKARTPHFELLRADHAVPPPTSGYVLSDSGESVLRALAEIAPRAGYAVIGRSREGRPIHAIWLGQPPDLPGATSLRVLGAHHGDELASSEVALAVARDLAERDQTDAAVTALLDRSTVWIAPWINPDGVMAGTRTNALGVDLNRNYDFQWDGDAYGAGEAAFSEPETRAVRALAALEPSDLSLSLHSGEINIGYVWNWTYARPPEDSLLIELGDQYAENCDIDGFWVTNGADWYQTTGDTNDWSYGRYAGMDFTVEVTREKTPDPSEIAQYTAAHVGAVRTLLTRPPDLDFTVVDRETGEGLEAEVVVHGVRAATDPIGGAIRRIGPWESAWVVAPGYTPVLLVAHPEAPVALQRAALSATRGYRASPGTTEIPMEGAPAGEVSLWRAGMASASGELRNDILRLDTAALPAGAWTLLFSDGSVWPRALLIEDALPLSGAEYDGEVLHLAGDQFSPGTRVFTIHGPARALHPAPFGEEEGGIHVDLRDIQDSMIDVLLVREGQVRALLDVTGDLDVDIPKDTGEPEPTNARCGCHSAPVALQGFLVGALWMRRRRK